jgi:hypothetical protein
MYCKLCQQVLGISVKEAGAVSRGLAYALVRKLGQFVRMVAETVSAWQNQSAEVPNHWQLGTA